MQTGVTLQQYDQLARGCHRSPHDFLGPHEVENEGRRALAIRAYLPNSPQVWVVDQSHGLTLPMRKIHPGGLYEAICPLTPNPLESKTSPNKTGANYLLKVTHADGGHTMIHDPYSFESLLTEFDLHLLGEGHHWKSYEKLGAQIHTINGVAGVNFAVWAPNADGVSVVGEFNDWDGRSHSMRSTGNSGIWELFIPGLSAGTLYKYEIHNHGSVFQKCDPYAFAAEVPPKTANIVTDLNDYEWQDRQWIEHDRHRHNALDAPMSVYEVHLGSWRRPGDDPSQFLTYEELAHQLGDYCTEMGFTHVELLPVSEHPFSGSWGYQTVGYFAATSRYGSPQELMYFIDHLHQRGIGVLVDWVPAHYPRDAHGLRHFDGSALYEHEDPRQGEHPDWGTMIFNYGRNEVCNFLISNALFWFDKYHLDGLRVDAVASMLYLDYSREEGEWIPNEYGGRENLAAIEMLKTFNEKVHELHPGVLTIAEESTAFGGVSKPTYLGGLGFSMKWNMGWMNDSLRYMKHEPIHRQYHHDELTFSLIYAFSENFVLPFSHDEVVHGKGSLLDQMPGDLWQKFANLRLLYSYMWTHPGKKLLFMGGEFGQWNEWNHDTSLQWDLLQWDSHQGLQRLCSDLNRLYRNEPAMHQLDFDPAGFEWIDCHDHAACTLSYIRRAKDPNDFLIVCSNFTPVPREDYKLGVPVGGWYEEIFNSDSSFYSGSNLGNGPGVEAKEDESHGRQHSVRLTLPPLATVVLKPRS